jgi:hypothetical protein
VIAAHFGSHFERHGIKMVYDTTRPEDWSVEKSSDGQGTIFTVLRGPWNFDEMIMRHHQWEVSLVETEQEQPIVIRKVRIPPGITIPVVTDKTLQRGYVPRGDGCALFTIERDGNSQRATFTFVAWRKNRVDANAWVAGAN